MTIFPQVLYLHSKSDNEYMEETNPVQDGDSIGLKRLRKLAEKGNRMTGGKIRSLPETEKELRSVILEFRSQIAVRYRISS